MTIYQGSEGLSKESYSSTSMNPRWKNKLSHKTLLFFVQKLIGQIVRVETCQNIEFIGKLIDVDENMGLFMEQESLSRDHKLLSSPSFKKNESNTSDLTSHQMMWIHPKNIRYIHLGNQMDLSTIRPTKI